MSKVGHFVIDIECVQEDTETQSSEYVVILSGDCQYKTEPHIMLTTALDVVCDFIVTQVYKDARKASKDAESERTL